MKSAIYHPNGQEDLQRSLPLPYHPPPCSQLSLLNPFPQPRTRTGGAAGIRPDSHCSLRLWGLLPRRGQQQLHQHHHPRPGQLLAIRRGLLPLPHRSLLRWPSSARLYRYILITNLQTNTDRPATKALTPS